MTPVSGRELKKIRDDAATIIFNLHLVHKISEDELHFLLKLLDIVVNNEENNLLPLLHSWAKQESHSENDSIIKATLLGLDFNDPEEVARTCSILRDLLQ
jgi:hypothetical protein